MSNNTNPATFEVIAQEDPDTGEVYLPFPQELLDKLGWKEGDTLDWTQSTNGAWILTKLNK